MGGPVRIHAIFHRTPPIVTEETASLWVTPLASANVRATFTPRTDLVVMPFGTTIRCVLELTESKLEVPTELSSIFKSRHHTPNMRSSWRWPDRTHSRPASSRASPPGVGSSRLLKTLGTSYSWRASIVGLFSFSELQAWFLPLPDYGRYPVTEFLEGYVR